MNRRILLALVLGLVSAAVFAQPWPNKPVKIIVGAEPRRLDQLIAVAQQQ